MTRFCPASFGALLAGVPALLALTTLSGCNGKPTVTLYSDLDRSIVEPLAKQFQEEKKVAIEVVYADPAKVQAGVGLSERITEESNSPKADIYWGCSPQALGKLSDSNLVAVVANSSRLQIAGAFSDPDLHWVGIGARVRVLVYNPQAFAGKKPPISLAALGQPRWKGRVAWADPHTNGNANYHLLSYFAAYREDEGKRLLRKMKANQVQLLPDENAVVEAVASGKADWGITDSDVATAAVLAKKPVDYLVPDQENFSTSDALDQVRGTGVPTLGTVALPFPLTIVQNHPHTQDASKLTDFLMTPQTALALAHLAPNLLLTRAGTEEDKPGRDGAQLVHADKLRFATLGMDKLRNIRPVFTLALQEIL